jgi:hypothetical protein
LNRPTVDWLAASWHAFPRLGAVNAEPITEHDTSRFNSFTKWMPQKPTFVPTVPSRFGHEEAFEAS